MQACVTSDAVHVSHEPAGHWLEKKQRELFAEESEARKENMFLTLKVSE